MVRRNAETKTILYRCQVMAVLRLWNDYIQYHMDSSWSSKWGEGYTRPRAAVHSTLI